MRDILFVSHCILNPCSKVHTNDVEGMERERALAIKLINTALEKDISIVQLPCPEILMYGTRRWGHAKSQFDNTFFKDKCRELLAPILAQIIEYTESPKYQVIGVIGVDGSPSCGVNFTYDGEWYGELCSNKSLRAQIESIYKQEEKGVFMQMFADMLKENALDVNILSLGDQGIKSII